MHTQNNKPESTQDAFTRLYRVIQKLRSPDGCPWDRKQTPESLLPNIIEEAYECIDAIKNKDTENTKEELGDLFLLAAMITSIYEEKEQFTICDVLNNLTDKLVRRHPHVFSNSNADNPEEVIKLWDNVKNQEKQKKNQDSSPTSILDSVPKSAPPIERSYKIQKAISKVGFDWKYSEGIFGKLNEEILEFKEALETEDKEKQEEELGDIIFSAINLGRYYKIHPELALHRTNKKFENRFRKMETEMQQTNTELNTENMPKMDVIWNKIKGQM